MGVGAVWQVGDRGYGYRDYTGTLSVQNSLGYPSYFYVGGTRFGPVGYGSSFVVKLDAGTWYVRDGFGHSKLVTIEPGGSVYLIFS